MILKIQKLLIVGLTLVLMSSCGNYQKVLKSTDNEYKYKKAFEYFEQEEYAKSSVLFGELVNLYRGTRRAPEAYYFYSKSLLAQKDYITAGYYFNLLKSEYPRSEYTEEAYFQIGYCFYKESPKPRLDQTNTQKAIDAFSFFLNLYPESKWAAESQKMITELNEKLVYKSYLSGKLYYDLGEYKAATISLRNCLKDYPDTKYKEDIMYMLFESKYLLAINSVEEKKHERLISALDEYYTFIDEWADSKYLKNVQNKFKVLSKLLNLEEINTEE